MINNMKVDCSLGCGQKVKVEDLVFHEKNCKGSCLGYGEERKEGREEEKPQKEVITLWKCPKCSNNNPMGSRCLGSNCNFSLTEYEGDLN